jgi:hypothetical protein
MPKAFKVKVRLAHACFRRGRAAMGDGLWLCRVTIMAGLREAGKPDDLRVRRYDFIAQGTKFAAEKLTNRRVSGIRVHSWFR